MGRKRKQQADFDKSSLLYFNEIGNCNPLTRDEEFNLWEKYKKNNDINARDKLLKSNLKFVASIAKNYQGLGLSYADLIAEGNMGLIKSFEKFDPTKGFKTISYSVWWIKQSILDALHKRNSLDCDELTIGDDVDAPESQTDEKLDFASDFDYICEDYDKDINNKDNKHLVELLCDCLNEREKCVISNYFGLNNADELTLEEIGDKLGLTKERIRQIKCVAFKKMRTAALSFGVTTI